MMCRWLACAALLLLAGCATVPPNPPITRVDPQTGYRFETRRPLLSDQETYVVLAFSGGGTRAAAFSYGVLEFLRRTEYVGATGRRARLLDEVAVISGVSGGSFTALAYGLYGDRLFDDYEQRFLKRNVQGQLLGRTLRPGNWGKLGSDRWGRSELAANLYDEVLFNGATFGDLNRGNGPLILASATDISTGSRFVFTQAFFDILCSDLSALPLSRAAAASSAVPVVLTPVTLRNYGGTCGRQTPEWARIFLDSPNPPRPSARAIRSLKSQEAMGDGKARPYLHLVDGGVSDNVGMRGVLDVLEVMEASNAAGIATPFQKARRIVVIVVNSLSVPPTDWDTKEKSPSSANILLKSSGVPIDHYSYESIEHLKDVAERWRTTRKVRQALLPEAMKDPTVKAALSVPDAEIYAIDVSFAELKDKTEFDYLNGLPTSFVLPDEAVDRLRAAAGTILLESPEFKRLLQDVGAQLVTVAPPASPR